ncbi:MAG: phosphonate ABC transporter, permease protein PhnE [Bdellovibrionales bacterium CG10_big_fil_rev_8_21_14_0_10_45_34]|nr:MAG: phosphonate ABC transporter, permease protein PhnE [Bdellovibrionales bacterium CG10_big_fil_rev_8_21_14_0_10_45_34]
MRKRFRGHVLDTVLFGSLFVGISYLLFKPNSQQLLELDKNVLVITVCLVLGAFLSIILDSLRIKTLGEVLFEAGHLKEAPETLLRTFWGWQLIVCFLAFFVAGLRITEFSFYELFSEQGFLGAKRIFSSLIDPNFAILPRAILAIVETIFIAFVATILSVPVAFLLSFLAARNIMGKSKLTMMIYGAVRTSFNITRSIEPLIWAIVFSVWVGIGPFAGMLALMLHSVASLAKLYSELIECVEDGPIEGIQSTGADPLQIIWFAVVPQVTLPVVAVTIYRWDINVRMATVIGLVGGGGIGTMLIQYQGQALWREVGCLVIVIAIVVWLMDMASAHIREAIK